VYNKIDYRYPNIVSDEVSNPYHSSNEKPLTQPELSRFLVENRLLTDDPNDPEEMLNKGLASFENTQVSKGLIVDASVSGPQIPPAN
jgi:hypothetical protein